MELSPLTNIDQIDDCSKNLIALRDALKIKGQLQQIEGKAKFTRDSSLTESEDYVALKQSFEQLSEEVRAKVNKI